MHTRFVVAMATLVSGCAVSPRYAYRPTRETVLEDAPSDFDGHAAASYPVPRTAPRGTVEVAAMGVATTKLPVGHGARTVRTLHVRMVVHNAGHEVWVVDAIDQGATINGTLHKGPVLARCDGDVMPQAVLMPDDTRTFDLYYELPPKLADAGAIPAVRVDWRVVTPAGVLERGSSAFERHDVPPPPVPPADPKELTRQVAKEMAQSRADRATWRN